MGLYGQNAYNATVYGNAAAGLSSVTFTANPSPAAYAGLLLNWSTPGGSWDRLRIVRNRFGFPVTPDDGTVLVDSYTPETYGSGQYGSGAYGGSVVTPTQYLDNSNLIPSTFYYYAMFVRQPQGAALPWTRVAVTIGQSVGDHKYKDWLLERIPSIFTTTGGSVEEGPEPGTAIARFLNVFGSDVNRARDFLDHLNHVEDPDTVHGDLLVTLCQNWGYAFEPSIGMKQNRVLAKNAVYLRQKKGTSAGVTSLASAVTGWGAKQLGLVNLMLDEDTASGEASTGLWKVNVGQATISRNTTLSFSDGNETSNACLQVTCNSTGEVSLNASYRYGFGMGAYGADPYSERPISTYGIPVTQNEQYVLSGYFRSNTTVVNPLFKISWFDSTGTILGASSVSDGTVATTTSSWTRISLAVNAPANAVWAQVLVDYPSLTSGDIQYFDAIQFEHCRNMMSAAASSFEDGTTGGWSATGNSSISNTTAKSYVGTHALLITTTTGGSPSFAQSAPSGAVPGQVYTASAYVTGASATGRAIDVSIFFLDNTHTTIGGTTVTGTTQLDGGSFVRVTATSAPAPSNASYVAMYITIPSTAATSEGHIVDAAQIELGSTATAYAPIAPSSYGPARQIRLQMIAPRVNEVYNAGFDVDVTQWSVFSGTATWTNTVTYNGGIGACKITPDHSGGFPQIGQYTVACDAGSPVVAAAQFFPTASATFAVQVQFTDSNGNNLGASVSTQGVLAANQWQQISVQTTAPAGAAGLILSLYQAQAANISQPFYVDDVQCEMTSVLQPYFDMRLNSGDVKWEGATYNSRLHYYPNFGPRDTRLSGLLTKHVPLGASYGLLFAQPRGTT